MITTRVRELFRTAALALRGPQKTVVFEHMILIGAGLNVFLRLFRHSKMLHEMAEVGRNLADAAEKKT